MTEKTTEYQIIQACLVGDRKAQSQLYELHKVYLFGLCQRYAKSRVEAEDMLIEGFYKVLKDLKHFKGDGDLRAWMRKVVVNTALMYIRKYRKVTYTELDQDVVEESKGFDYSMLEKERAQAIIALLQKLPPAQQLVFNLRAIDGYSFKEIASMTENNEATLRSHFLRARKQLQKFLTKETLGNG